MVDQAGSAKMGCADPPTDAQTSSADAGNCPKGQRAVAKMAFLADSAWRSRFSSSKNKTLICLSIDPAKAKRAVATLAFLANAQRRSYFGPPEGSPFVGV
jgi:hypothetical protein